MSLVLMRYQGRDWHGHVRIEQEMPEFFSVCLTCDSDTDMTVDVSIHVTRTTSRLLLSVFSPYWIINKTSRVLQYRAEDVSVKHPADYRDIILFSFRKKNLFSKSKVRNIPGQVLLWGLHPDLWVSAFFYSTKMFRCAVFFSLESALNKCFKTSLSLKYNYIQLHTIQIQVRR